jgi:ubiquinone/menaquinone biosynthesis C-methylase UbiE
MSDTANLFVDGQAYERMMGRWSQLAGATFLEWLAQPQGLRWLDVGCGNGAFTEVLIAKNAPAEVTGIDPSEGQLAYARTRPGTQRAQFRAAGAQDIPFGDDSFDAAVMPLVISFVPDPVKGVAEMARVVRPGGCVAAYMWDIPGGGLVGQPMHVAANAMGIQLPIPPSSEASRQSNMRALWERAGLASIETRVIRVPVTFADFSDFWDSLSSPVGPSGQGVANLPAQAHEELKTRLRKQLPQEASGRISYEAFANAVKGTVPV